MRGAVCAWGSVGSAWVKCLRDGTRAGMVAGMCCVGGSADVGRRSACGVMEERILEYCTSAFEAEVAG